MTILSVIKGKSVEEIEEDYKDQGYAQFKKDVAEAIVEELTPIQEKLKN